MKMVHGVMKFNVGYTVENDDYEGLLEANYNLNPNRIIAYKLVAVDHFGNSHEICVNELEDMNLDVFVGE
jgi:hypothetical protein